MCQDMQIPMLGKIPIEPKLLMSCEGGKCFIKECPDSVTAKRLSQVVDQIKSEGTKESEDSKNDSKPAAMEVI